MLGAFLQMYVKGMSVIRVLINERPQMARGISKSAVAGLLGQGKLLHSWVRAQVIFITLACVTSEHNIAVNCLHTSAYKFAVSVTRQIANGECAKNTPSPSQTAVMLLDLVCR